MSPLSICRSINVSLCNTNINNDLIVSCTLTVDSIKLIQKYRDMYQNWILIVQILVS